MSGPLPRIPLQTWRPIEAPLLPPEPPAAEKSRPATATEPKGAMNLELPRSSAAPSSRAAEIAGGVEDLLERGASITEIRAFVTHYERRDLQVLHRRPDLRAQIASLGTERQQLDLVERIGGALSDQMVWLEIAGVRAAPRDARRSPQMTRAR